VKKAYTEKNMLKTIGKSASVLCLLLSLAGLTASAQGRTIYSETADPHAEIKEALAKAAREHKRVIIDFGGNWCGDCQVLDIYFHQEPNASLLASNYVLVDVNIGHMDRNTDIAEKYGVPLKRGVPGLAVIDPNGTVVYSQRNGEFESMRKMDPNSVTEFLNTWKPKPRHG
jgi:thiol:disulfide interchange protein